MGIVAMFQSIYYYTPDSIAELARWMDSSTVFNDQRPSGTARIEGKHSPRLAVANCATLPATSSQLGRAPLYVDDALAFRSWDVTGENVITSKPSSPF
jgi:hypothetical protein